MDDYPEKPKRKSKQKRKNTRFARKLILLAIVAVVVLACVILFVPLQTETVSFSPRDLTRSKELQATLDAMNASNLDDFSISPDMLTRLADLEGTAHAMGNTDLSTPIARIKATASAQPRN